MGLALSIILIFAVFPLMYGYSKNGAAGIVGVLLVFAWFGIPALVYGYVSETAGLIILCIEVVVMIGYAIHCNINK